MTPKSQLPHNRERGVQMDRQRPEAAEFGWTSDCSRVAGQDLRRWLVADDAEKTECDERVAQRCGESPRLTPFQKHEGERACLRVCTMRFPACGSVWKMYSGSPENSGFRTRSIRFPNPF